MSESEVGHTYDEVIDPMGDVLSRIDRECFWCEDCLTPLPKDYMMNNEADAILHVEHDVVPITIVSGWNLREAILRATNQE